MVFVKMSIRSNYAFAIAMLIAPIRWGPEGCNMVNTLYSVMDKMHRIKINFYVIHTFSLLETLA
jgi:hypothetical protein